MGPAGAVVVGGYINGLGLVRAFAARGIPVAVVCTEAYDIAQYSRFVVASERSTDASGGLLEVLDRRSADWRGWALIPSTDDALAAIAADRERLSSIYHIIAPSPDATRQVLDKRLMRETARSLGIDVPTCYGATNDSLVIEDVRYPAVVKPVVGYPFLERFGCKLFAAGDRAELERSIAKAQAAGMACQVFDRVPGGDDRIYAYCTYIDQRGEPLGGVTIRKLRQSPPFFGVARVAEVVEDVPQLRDATIELARRMGLRGMAAAEFKFDERDGTWRFMEINGRSVIYNSLLREAGLDLAGMAWGEHMEGRSEMARPTGWSGVWVNLHADLLYSALRRREQALSWGEFVTPYTRPMREAVWSAGDPRPFLVQWGRTLREAVSSVRPTSR